MKMYGKIVLILCCVFVFSGTWFDEKEHTAAAECKYKIAYISFVNNPWWLLQQQGAMAAKRLLEPREIQVDWITAASSPDVDALNKALSQAITGGYHGILFAPLSAAHAPFTQKAMDSGIPVIQFALYAKDLPSLSYVGANYYEGGRVCAQAMLQGLKQRNLKQGKIAILSAFNIYNEWRRNQGFRDYFQKYGSEFGSFELLADVDSKDAPDVILNQTLRLLANTPDLVGIYLTSGSQYAMANAILQVDAQEKIVAVAHEGTGPNLEALMNGGFYCLVDAHAFRTALKAGLVMADYLLHNISPPEFVYITNTMIWPNDVEGVKAELEAVQTVNQMQDYQ